MAKDNDTEPYFRIDGVRISDHGGEVVYREYRKSPLGDNIQANDGLFYTMEGPS